MTESNTKYPSHGCTWCLIRAIIFCSSCFLSFNKGRTMDCSSLLLWGSCCLNLHTRLIKMVREEAIWRSLLLLLLLGIRSGFAAGLIYAQSSVVKIESRYWRIHGSRKRFAKCRRSYHKIVYWETPTLGLSVSTWVRKVYWIQHNSPIGLRVCSYGRSIRF